MIQRIQSLFIIIAIALMASLMIWPIDTFGSAQGMAELRWNGVFDITPGSTEPVISLMIALAAIIIAPIALNAVGLFLYKKNRLPLQMRLVGIAAGFEICVGAFLIYLSYETATGMGAEAHFCIRWLLPILAGVLDILAYRRISDDAALYHGWEHMR